MTEGEVTSNTQIKLFSYFMGLNNN